MRVCVLGTGYVGLVAGACLSDSGNHVECVDVNQEKVHRLLNGEIPIFEPGLEEMVARNLKAKRLAFTTSAVPAIAGAKVVFVAVGTPSAEDGSLDLRYVLEAVRTIRDAVKEETTVVMKSTVPVGTADQVRAILKDAKVKVEVVSNPEFLKEGTAVDDFLRPERVIIGCESEAARHLMSDLYAPYIRSGNPILFMDNRSAELAKYAANGFLAMKISFVNDLALLAESVGADIHEVRRALVTDTRIGGKFLYPGCGYGGSCFPKDVLALIQLGKENGLQLSIFKSVHEVNERQKRVIFEKIQRHFKGDLKGKTVGIWGLSFKPMTDDMREAPSVVLINALLKAEAKVRAYDPVAAHEARRLFEGKVELCDEAYEVAVKADALAIMTEWNEFRSPDFNLLKREMVRPLIFDGRNLYRRESLERQGFTYYCIGKPDPQARVT
jgi:UDPglucose 6-dehydrogenase